MRTLVVGDTHGAYKGLQQALKAAQYDGQSDRLVVLGDTFDGWSQAPQLIDYYMMLQQDGCDLVYVRGNHDDAFLNWVENGCRQHMMEGHGGHATRHVYTTLNTDDIERHYLWVSSQRLCFVDEQNRAFVHAGWDEKYAFDNPAQAGLREYLWNRSFWRGMYEGRNWAKQFTDVFLGHSPTVFFKPYLPLPMTRRNVHNLDTGAAFKGKVTVMDAATKAFWQSERCQDLYPLERGRN